jgi:hypothetical protein
MFGSSGRLVESLSHKDPTVKSGARKSPEMRTRVFGKDFAAVLAISVSWRQEMLMALDPDR